MRKRIFLFFFIFNVAFPIVPTSAHECGEALVKLAKKQSHSEISKLLNNGCDELEHKDGNQDTAVLITARSGNLRMLKLLVKHGADINVLDAKRRDVLNIAITSKNPALARKALQLGADPTLVTSVYDGGAIIYGAAQGAVEIVDMLIEAGAPVNRVNNLGWTALLEVAILGNGTKPYQDIARSLIEAGADPNKKDRSGKTPYDHAIAKGQKVLANILKPS